VLASACGDAHQSSAGIGRAAHRTIGLRTLQLVDATRTTRANGPFPGAPSRTLPTDVWYPATASGSAAEADAIDCQEERGIDPAGCALVRDAALDASGAPYPLVVLSHGFGNGKEALRYFAIALAEHGYVVAAPTFPLSNRDAPGGPIADDLVEQARDVSFVADVMLDHVAGAPSPFPGAIDRDRLGTGGRSLGGSTTLLVAFHPDFRDPRLRAAAPISPSYDVAKAVVRNDRFFDGIATPLLVVGGSDDDLAPFGPNQQLAYDRANPPKILVDLIGEGHVPEVEATNRALVAFFDVFLRGRTSELAVFDDLPGARVEHAP